MKNKNEIAEKIKFLENTLDELEQNRVQETEFSAKETFELKEEEMKLYNKIKLSLEEEILEENRKLKALDNNE